ncbi:Carboxypeptidase A2 [Nymphon striatum]|nr:Carboxypeptidase A2 [Nymphon striatum]
MDICVFTAHEGSSTNPCSVQYSGPQAESEPETRGIKEFVQTVENRIISYYSIHAYSELWMIPYAYTTARSVDYQTQIRIHRIPRFPYRHGTDRNTAGPFQVLSMWRKNRRPSNYPGCNGVDVNRNFNIDWNAHEGSSTNPCSVQYSGPQAESEPETRGIKEFVQTVENRIISYYSIHAYSELWMIPYAYTTARSVDYQTQMAAANIGAAALKKLHGVTYTTGPISETIYKVSGSTIDYIYGMLGVKYSFAVELRDRGQYGFFLPKSLIIPTASEFFNGVKAVINYVKNH